MKEFFTKSRLLTLLLILFFSNGILLAQNVTIIRDYNGSGNVFRDEDGWEIVNTATNQVVDCQQSNRDFIYASESPIPISVPPGNYEIRAFDATFDGWDGGSTLTITNGTTGNVLCNGVTLSSGGIGNNCPGPSGGGVVICSFTVTAGVPPQISCPPNSTFNNLPGQCGAPITYTATETTGVPASTITYSPASGSFFPIGTTTVTATATNASGSSECTFTVTVNDTEKPAISCPANINATATSFNGAAVGYTAPTGTDNCPGAITTRVAGPASGSTFPIGTTPVTYRVTDAAGNTTECSFTVTVALPTCGNKNQNVQICYYGVTQCVSEKIAKNYIKLGATLGPCNAGNTRIGVEETSAPITLSLKAYPNPVQDAVTVEVMAPAAGMATLEVLDVTGLTRQSRQQQLSEGSNEVGLRLGSLPTGIYLIRAIDALGHQAVVRVNKQ